MVEKEGKEIEEEHLRRGGLTSNLGNVEGYDRFYFGQAGESVSKWQSSGRITAPPDGSWGQVRGYALLQYPVLTCNLRSDDPTDYPDGTVYYYGFELGAGVGFGAAFVRVRNNGGTLEAELVVGGMGGQTSVEVTDLLPSDFLSTKYSYTIEVRKNFVALYSKYRRLKAMVVTTPPAGKPIDEVITENAPPYACAIKEIKPPRRMPPLIEAHQPDTGSSDFHVYCDISDYRWYESPVAVPDRSFVFSQWESNETLVSGSPYDSAVTSHPVILRGYDKRTILFQADTSGDLDIEVYTLEGNWRTYDTISISANTLENYIMTGKALFGRITYTPDAGGATINEAEIHLGK